MLSSLITYKRNVFVFSSTSIFFLIFFYSSIHAQVIWDGDAKKGTGVFGTLNMENGSTLTTDTDPTYGLVWKFTKPVGSNRGESSHLPNNLHAKEGDIWYIGWRFKLDIPQNYTTNAVFQWKTYPSPSLQNWPVVLKTVEGSMYLMVSSIKPASGYYGKYIWQTPTVVNQWINVVLQIKVSGDSTKGYLEFWQNGVKQTFMNGSSRYYSRTLDGDYTDPKWGIYGAPDIQAINYVHSLRIAATYDEADPLRATSVGEKEIIPTEFSLQNYPNPFNPSTVISYQLPTFSKVQLKIYDVLGREVATLVNEEQQPGGYKVNFNWQQSTNNKQISSGIYFARIQAGLFTKTIKMVMLK